MEFIASGAQADTYRENNKAIKLFKKNISKTEVEYEMNLQKMAYEQRLPVPMVYDFIEIEGRYGFLMEFIEGISVGKLIQNNKNRTEEYLTKTIEIQIGLNEIITNKFPSLKNTLYKLIQRAPLLEENDKQNILGKLNKINFDNYLCHGDFHIMNLIETSKGIKIIDWVNSSSGNAEADIYRTYLLYKLFSEELGELFIKNYLKIKQIPKENILNWAGIIAAARLSEGRDKVEMEKLIKIVNENI